MTAVLYVDHLRGNTWLNDGARLGLWGATIGANIAGGAASGYTATKGILRARLKGPSVFKDVPLSKGGMIDGLRSQIRSLEKGLLRVEELGRAKAGNVKALEQSAVYMKSKTLLDRELAGLWKGVASTTTARAIGNLVAAGSVGYVSNPWGTPLTHPRGDGVNSGPAAGASFESIPAVAEYSGAHSDDRSAPMRSVREVMSE